MYHFEIFLFKNPFYREIWLILDAGIVMPQTGTLALKSVFMLSVGLKNIKISQSL